MRDARRLGCPSPNACQPPSTRSRPGPIRCCGSRTGPTYQANGALALAKQLGTPPRQVAEDGGGRGLARRRVRRGRGQRARVHQPDPLRRVRGPAGGRRLAPTPGSGWSRRRGPRRWSSTTRRPTWPRRCTSATSAAPSSATRWPRARLPRPRRHPREPHRRLGYALRHAHRAPARRGRGRRAESFSVRDLNEFYATARRQFDQRPGVRRAQPAPGRAPPGRRRRDAAALADLRGRVRCATLDEVYDMLGVLLTDEDMVGESFYNPLLPVVVDELDGQGTAGRGRRRAVRVPPGVREPQRGAPPAHRAQVRRRLRLPATDLAAIRDRTGRLGAQRARLRGRAPSRPSTSRWSSPWPPWPATCPTAATAEHVAFGLVLGADGKKLASRSGGLRAPGRPARRGVDRAAAAMAERAERPPAERSGPPWPTRSASGAVKYADLSTDRMRDYVFDWDRMLAFEGNTGPYLQYAHARIRSIFRRGGVAPPDRAPCRCSASPPSARSALRAAPLRRGGRGHGGDVQPVEALHLPVRPGHHLHRVLRGLPGAGRRRGGPRLAAWPCATSRPGCSHWGSRCSVMEAPEQM